MPFHFSRFIRHTAGLMALGWSLCAGAQLLGPAGANNPAVVQTPQVRAELVALAPQGVTPGQTVWAGLRLTHQPQWHTYWKNAGDSGLPTQLRWTLPAGVTAGDIDWPAPQLIHVATLANYGYEGTVLLPVPLTVSPQFKPQGDHLELRLSANWLVCKEECVPQDGNFVLSVPLRGSTALLAPEFAAARKATPVEHRGNARIGFDGGRLLLQVQGLPAQWQGQALDVFPETAEIIETARTPTRRDRLAGAPGQGQQQWDAQQVWHASMPLSGLRIEAPEHIPVVLSLGGTSLRTVAKVEGAWPPLPVPPSASPSVSTATGAVSTLGASNASIMSTAANPSLGGWLLALGAALLGGLILNLMPCVFPVLAIKVLAIARHAGAERNTHRAEGVAYAAGVVLSFLALGALMLSLRATGEQLGWGFQLQSPWAVAALAVLFTLIGLNLAGLMDVNLPLPSGLAGMRLRHPLADAFLSGVLAVAVASPCTAPFMGASLGYAIGLPAPQALAIFGALGLGLAAPFLAVAAIPALGNLLPRPGAWMDTLRRFMAFPMWATVVWLLWVLGHLSGVDGAASLLMVLLCMALLVWALGLPGASRRWMAGLALLLTAAALWALGPNIWSASDGSTVAGSGTSGAPLNHADGIWQPWSNERVAQETAAGRAVFVDYTAAWCITCQVNKKTTLSNATVLAAFAKRNVTLLRADWTRRDPAITAALVALGRSGVPVYVLHAPGRAPVVFSEVLGTGDLLRAVDRL